MAEEETRSTRIFKNILVCVAIIPGIMLGYQTGLKLGPFDPLESAALAMSLLTGAGVASIRPRWRPAMSTLVAISLAIWAWVTALFGVELLLGSGKSGFGLILSTSFTGIAYLSWFRWAGQAELRRRANAERNEAGSELHRKLSGVVRFESRKLRKQIKADAEKLAELMPKCECPPVLHEQPPTPLSARQKAVREIRRARYGG